MALNVRSLYGGRGSVSSVLPREGVDIGPRPDFWGDLDQFARRMKRGKAGEQAKALSGMGGARGRAASNVSSSSAPPSRLIDSAAGSPDMYDPIFGTLTYPHGSAGFYQPYAPGMMLGSGQAPVAMGYTRRRSGGGRR